MIVCLHKGTGIIGKLIKWQTRGQYSHASIYCGNGVLFESREFNGVQFSRINKSEDVDYFFVSTTPEQEAKALEFMNKTHNKGYDYKMVFRFISRLPEANGTKNKYFCSELVFDLFEYIGINLFKNTKGWQVSPSMLAKSIYLENILYEENILFNNLAISSIHFDKLHRFARPLIKNT